MIEYLYNEKDLFEAADKMGIDINYLLASIEPIEVEVDEDED